MEPDSTITVEIPENTTFAFGSKGEADPVTKIVKQIKWLHVENSWVPAP